MAFQFTEAVDRIVSPYILGAQLEIAQAYRQRQEMLIRNPLYELDVDYHRFHDGKDVSVGFPEDIAHLFNYLGQENIYVILGTQIGDEGKGRIVDNVMDYLANKGLRIVYVTRFQGGSNSGHTLEKNGVVLKHHQVPSVSFQPENVEVKGIMDGGIQLNPDEFQKECEYIQAATGEEDITKRLIISQYAILNTDLDRAEEVLLDLQNGKQAISTATGMRTSTAHYYDRTGLLYYDFLQDNWKERLGARYDEMEARLHRVGKALADIDVPDYDEVVRRDLAKMAGQPEPPGPKTRPVRKIGTKTEFLERLEKARAWIIEKNLVQDTIEINWQSLNEIQNGIAGHIFEGAQAIGLHPWLGTLNIKKRDTTSTITTPEGVLYATKVINDNGIKYKIGVFKATYMSSVGGREMPTWIRLSKEVRGPTDLPANATDDMKFAAWVREEAKEYGTTTGRPRDICYIDLPFLAYNCYAGGVNMLAATHLDIARKDMKLKVCTHYYDNKKRRNVAYYPGIDSNPDIEAQYVEFDAWDPEEVRRARLFDELPENAKIYLSFIQARVGIPIVFSTTGPDRESYIRIPQQEKRQRKFFGIPEIVYSRFHPQETIFPN